MTRLAIVSPAVKFRLETAGLAIPHGHTVIAQGVALAATAEFIDLLAEYEDAECVRANPGDVVKLNTNESFYLDGWKGRSIADGVTFDCLRLNGHPVVNVPRYWLLDLEQASVFSWQCWNQSTARGKVVRVENGSSWYVDLRGGRHWIPDGGTFDCIRAQGKADYGLIVPVYSINELTQFENAECVRANPGDVVKLNTNESFYLDGWTPLPITNGITFDCLRLNGHPVVNVPRYWLLDLGPAGSYTWNCWNQGAAQGTVVRVEDGTSWYIDFRGGRHWIPDGGTFNCIRNQGRPDYGVIVPRYSVNELPQYENAQCIVPQNWDIIRHSDGDAYIWHSGYKFWIPDGRSYNCFRARGFRLLNNLPRYWISDTPSGENYTVGEACQLILRHAVDGDAHVIDAAGVRHWIPTGAVYNCLVGRGYPVYNTTDRNLINTGWPEGNWATCAT